jgi:hypothetical protein
MRRAASQVAVGLAVAGLLAACAPQDVKESGNSCALPEIEDVLGSGGIGGTGILAQDGGIGGTGIVGTITGFGSICVNGLEVHFDGSVAVTANGSPSAPAQLAVGQVVAVETSMTAKGLLASSIAILESRYWSFGPSVARVWLEGIVERRADGDVLVVSGRSIPLPGEAQRAGDAPAPGSRLFVLAVPGKDGALEARRVVVPRRVTPRVVNPPAGVETRTIEPLRDFRFDPRMEPRLPAPGPSSPGRRGR